MLKLPGVLFHVAIAQLLLFYTARPKNAEQGAALLTDLVPGGSLFFFQGVSAAAPGPRTGAPRKDDGYDSEFSDLDESPRLLTTDPYSVAQPGGTTAAGVGPREEEDVDLHFSPAREDPYQQVDQECHPDLQPAAAAAKKEGAAGPGAGTTTLAAAPASATCSEVRRRDKGPRRVDVEEGEDLLPPELCADELESFCEDSEDEDFDFAALGERFPEDGEIYVSEDEDQDFPYDDDWDVDFEGQYKEKRSRSRPGYDSRTPTPPPRQEKQDPEVVHVEQRGPSPLQERVAVAARAGQQEYGRGSSSAPRGRRSGAVSSSRSRSRSRRPGPRLQLHANYTQSSSSRPGVLQLHAREEPGRRSSPPRSRSRSSTCRKKRNKHKAEAGDGDRAEARKQMEGTRSPPRTNGSRGRNRSRTSRGRNHRKCGRTSEDEYVFPEIKFKPKNYTPSLRQQAEDAFYQDWKKAQKQNPHAYPFFNALVNFFPKVSDPSAPMNQLEFFLDDHVENNPVGGRTSNGRRGNGRGRGAAAATSTATIQSLFRFFDFGLTIKHPWQTSQKLWSPAKPQELWGMVKKYVVKLNEKNPSLFIPVPNISVPGYLQQEADHLNKVKAEGRRHDDQKVDPYNPLQRLDNGVGGAVALVRLKAEEDPLAKAMTKWYQYEKHPYDHYEDETRRESDWGRTNEPKSWSWYKFDSEKEKVHLVNQATKVYGGQKTELLRLDSLWKLAALVIKKGNEEKNRLLQLKAEEMQESGLTQEAERSPRAGGYFSLTLFGLSAGEKALYQHLLRRSQEEESSAVVVVGSGRDEYLQKVNEQMEKEWRDKNREKYDEQGVMRKELRERSNSTGVEGGETSWTSTSWWKKHQPEKDHSFEFQAGKHVLERQVANEYRAVKIKKWYKMMVAIRPFEQLEEKATARQHVPLQQGLAAARVRKFLEKKVSGKRIFLPLAGSGSLYVKAVKQFRRSICPFALEMKKDDATRQWEKTDDGQNYVFAKTPTTLEEAQHQLNSSILLHNLVYANACQVAVTTFGKWGENNEKLYYDQKLNVYYTTLTASTGETGKTHQLRAHVVAFFAKHGYHAHLVGDELYAKVATDPKYRQSFLFPGPEEAALLQYQTSASGIKSNMGSLPPSLQELREQSNRIRKAMKNLGQFDDDDDDDDEDLETKKKQERIIQEAKRLDLIPILRSFDFGLEYKSLNSYPKNGGREAGEKQHRSSSRGPHEDPRAGFLGSTADLAPSPWVIQGPWSGLPHAVDYEGVVAEQARKRALFNYENGQEFRLMPTKTAVDYLSADLDVVGGEVEKDHPMNLSNIAADDAKSLLLAYKRDQIDFYVSHHRDSRMDRDSTVAAEQVVDEETKKSQNRINDLFSMFLKKETRIMGLHSWKAEVCVRVLVANKGELVLDYPGRRVDHRKNENRKVLCEQKISEPGWWEVWLRQKRLQNKETFKEVV